MKITAGAVLVAAGLAWLFLRGGKGLGGPGEGPGSGGTAPGPTPRMLPVSLSGDGNPPTVDHVWVWDPIPRTQLDFAFPPEGRREVALMAAAAAAKEAGAVFLWVQPSTRFGLSETARAWLLANNIQVTERTT